MTDSSVAEFCIRLLHSVTSGHIMHLQTRSFSQHMALSDFYSGIGDLADSIIEAYQGQYGIIEEYPNGYKTPSMDPLSEILNLSDFVKKRRNDMPSDSEIQNLIDEVQSLIDSTLYKLRFLA